MVLDGSTEFPSSSSEQHSSPEIAVTDPLAVRYLELAEDNDKQGLKMLAKAQLFAATNLPDLRTNAEKMGVKFVGVTPFGPMGYYESELEGIAAIDQFNHDWGFPIPTDKGFRILDPLGKEIFFNTRAEAQAYIRKNTYSAQSDFFILNLGDQKNRPEDTFTASIEGMGTVVEPPTHTEGDLYPGFSADLFNVLAEDMAKGGLEDPESELDPEIARQVEEMAQKIKQSQG